MIDFDVTTISEDYAWYLENWKINPGATEYQKRRWPPERKISRELLGGNARNALCLTREDGYARDETLGSCGRTVARRFFWNQSDTGEILRHWPASEEIIRFGVFFHLDVYRAISLLLKAQWEKYFLDKVWGDAEDRSFIQLLKYEDARILEYLPAFHLGYTGKYSRGTAEPAVEAVYEQLEAYRYLSDSGYAFEGYKKLVHTLIQSSVFLSGTRSSHLAYFIESYEKENQILRRSSAEESEEFWVVKCTWLEKENELGRLLVELDEQRLRNANIQNEWYREFGPLYVRFLETETEYLRLSKRIQLKQANEDLTREEIDALVREEEIKREGELENKKRKMRSLIDVAALKMPFREDALVDYAEEAKRIERNIWKYTHPDSHYRRKYRFTERQIEKLGDFYRQVTELRDHEVGNYTRRSLNDLLDIWGSVRFLYKNMGYDVETREEVEGNSLEEMTHWLLETAAYIDAEILKIRNEIFVLRNLEDTREKQDCLASRESIENIKRQFEQKTSSYEEQLPVLREQLKQLFGCRVCE